MNAIEIICPDDRNKHLSLAWIKKTDLICDLSNPETYVPIIGGKCYNDDGVQVFGREQAMILRKRFLNIYCQDGDYHHGYVFEVVRDGEKLLVGKDDREYSYMRFDAAMQDDKVQYLPCFVADLDGVKE